MGKIDSVAFYIKGKNAKMQCHTKIIDYRFHVQLLS